MKPRSNVLSPPIWIVFGIFFCCLAVIGQSKLEPALENFKAVNDPGSPVQIVIDGFRPSGPESRMFGYKVQNVGTNEIRSIIIRATFGTETRNIFLGLPGTMVDQFGFERGLRTGGVKSFPFLLTSFDGKSVSKQIEAGLVLTTDFVLFRDGTTWGPDAAGESEFLLGIFEGYERFLSNTKKLVAEKDDAGLKTVINRDGPPAEMVEIQNRTKRQIGYGRGYSVARLAFQADLLGRGDLTGVKARIRDMERELGLVPLKDDKHKQITYRFSYKEPISITGFSLGGRSIALDERFSANGDWLTGLEINIKNNSGKTIKFVSLGIYFPETQNTGQGMSSSLRYGPHPITFAEDVRQPRVGPDQTFKIIIDAARPGSLKRFLELQQSFDTISRAVIDINYIDFEDGTRWSGGQVSKRDPENPDRWITVK
ncbi:MAG: hypothetical protein ABIV48_05495 [Pyrinomonadaceae bacterium]